jgi:signal transduction histidine kinase/CheY-like chemotaxis protein
VHWKFAHDRIQQAVYSLIPDGAKQDVHYRIGQLLLASVPAGERGQELFAIVDQLNVAIARIPEAERRMLAQLNLDAGCKAKNSAAYGPAYNYLSIGIDLLGAEAWHTDYTLCLALHDEITEAAFLRGDFPRMQYWSEQVLHNAQTLLDKLSVYELRIQGFMARNQQIEAVRSALEVLKLLGVNFPSKPTLLDTWLELAKTRAVLLGRSSASIMALPRMTDTQQLAIMRILASIWSAAYQAVPPLMPLLVFKMVRTSIRHGNCPQSVLCYAWYGLLLCGVVGDIPTGYRFGELALKLLDVFEARQLRARLFFVVNCFVRHWKEPAEATLEPSAEAYRVGLETGALEFAAYASVVYCYHSFIMGRTLPTLQKEMALYSQGLAEIKQEISLNYTLAFHQTTLNLTDPSDDPGRLIGAVFDERERILQAEQANDRTGLCFYYFNKTMLCLIFDRPEEALANAELARRYLDGVPALYVGPACVFYGALAQVAAIPQALPAQRKTLLRQVRAAHQQLQAWAVHAPHSYQQKALLIRAELARVLKRPQEARELYDQAIAQAQEHEFRNEEALACDLAARFYTGRGQTALACHYLRGAHHAYLQWGATAKATEMEQRYPEAFVRGQRSATVKSAETISQSSVSGAANFLDITTLMKASHAISGEIVLDRLIEKLLTIVLKNAGAQRAWLLLEREGRWSVVAQADSQTGQVILQTVMLEAMNLERPELPVEILYYVIRTRKPLVLSDARHNNPFSEANYILQKQPQSVLCSPIVHQGRLGGLLYLENNLLPSAFTENHLATLDILSAQIAISIENALYYRKLEAAHRAEQARIAAEAASQAKSDFLAHMSHELRTPLNAILGYTQILQRDKALNNEQIKGVAIIRQSGEHLLSLINDILDLSKIEAGRLELAPTDFNLRDFIDRIAAPMALRAKEKDISFIYKEDTALPEGIRADERRLRQIFFNLLGNALKFTDQGGVTLRVGFVHETLSVAVEDTGCGIAQDELEKVFLPFHQTGSLLHRQQGTGLGLPITRKLIEAMGGKLVIGSRLGQGSVFRFTLAVKALVGLPPEAGAKRATVIGFEGASRNILVVDDNTHNRRLLQSLLKPLGFAMEEAEDGMDALEKLSAFHPNLILMDLVMPKMDGFECTRRIRQHPEYHAVPIVLISASILNQEQQDFVNTGCNAFLLKPIQLDALLDELARLLSLKWVYTQAAVASPQQSPELTQATAATLVLPSAERLRNLYDLSLRGDIQAILNEANAFVGEDVALVPFAKVITELAKSFQERKLQAFVKQYLAQG